MNLPNLPTDNLYKFIALTGVILLVITIFYPEYQRKNLRDEIEVYNGEVRKLTLEKTKSTEKQKEVKKRIAILDEKSNCNCQSIVNDSIIVRTQIIEGPKELIELSKEIDKLIEEYTQLNRDFDLKSLEISTKLALINNKENDLFEINEVTGYFGPFSLLIAFIGFLLWYEKTQKFQDKVLKEQAAQYLNIDFCQSCGMRLSNQKNFHKISDETKIHMNYCHTCYTDGEFTEPDLTLKEMKEKVTKRCKELGYNKIITYLLARRIDNLERWRDKFQW
jgi:hypothetical protein